MASIPITNLPVAISVNAVDQVPIVQAGTTVRATVSQLSTAIAQQVAITDFLAYLLTLPTTLPAKPGVLWNNGGTLCIS